MLIFCFVHFNFAGTQALRHSGTQSLRHSVTQSLRHSGTQALRHSATQALSHSGTQSLRHSATQALSYSATQPLSYSGTQLLSYFLKLQVLKVITEICIGRDRQHFDRRVVIFIEDMRVGMKVRVVPSDYEIVVFVKIHFAFQLR
jgi:hypothetical protein